VQRAMMALATLPGYAIAKQLVIVYGHAWWPVMLCTALVEWVYGTRFSLVGMLAFQTLPSRELVAVWQLLTIVVGTLVPFVVLIVGYTSQLNYSNLTNVLIGVGVAEGVRFGAMCGLTLGGVHHKENLSTL